MDTATPLDSTEKSKSQLEARTSGGSSVLRRLKLSLVTWATCLTIEFLPYLQTAAKSSDKSGMSCDKAAVINISSIGGSVSSMPGMHHQYPLLPYCVSKAGLNMLTALAGRELKADEILCMALHPGWVKTDMGGENADIETRDSVAGMLKVMSDLTENEHGGFMEYTGQTLSW